MESPWNKTVYSYKIPKGNEKLDSDNPETCAICDDTFSFNCFTFTPHNILETNIK